MIFSKHDYNEEQSKQERREAGDRQAERSDYNLQMRPKIVEWDIWKAQSAKVEQEIQIQIRQN